MHKSNSDVTVVFVRSKAGTLLEDMSDGYAHILPVLSGERSSRVGSSGCCWINGNASLFSG